MKNIQTPILAIDFEGSRKIGVVEYGVAEIAGGEIVATSTRICAPRTKISRMDAEFFDIDNATAAKCPPFEDSLDEFCKMRARGIFLSHNALVEDSLLRDALPSPGNVENCVSNERTCEWSPWLDTCALVKNIFPNLETAKLSDVIRALNLENLLSQSAEKFCPNNRRKWHCALYDALAAAHILIYICQQKGFEEVDLPWLAKFSGDKSSNQRSLF